MCRIEERIYVRADGNRSKFEETFHCDKARGGRLCAKVNRRTTEYYPKNATLTRDDTPSPINPPTPNSPGTYLVQQRRPSGTVARPSTRDGQKVVKPEIIIEFGSKKGKSSKYPSISVSNGTYKRSSMGASSVASSDAAVESPGSDASHTIRTGFPDAPLSPSVAFSHNDGFISSPDASRGNRRHTSSVSSYTTSSSRTPSLYVTSDPDYDSPTGHSTERYPTIVHNPPTIISTSSSPSRKPSGTPTTYRIELVSPQGSAQESRTPAGFTPLDLSDRSSSSYASSVDAESTRRGKDRDREDRRKKKEEERRRQEELDRLVAERLAATENVKQVRFELGRAEARDHARQEATLAEKERRRGEDREEARRRKEEERKKLELEDQARMKEEREQTRIKEEREREQARMKEEREQARIREEREQAQARAKEEREQTRAKEEREQTRKKADRDERKKEKSTKSSEKRSSKQSTELVKPSMTQAQLEERARLLAAEGLYMQGEREAAEAREREERASFIQQQEQPGYYDPRGGNRSLSHEQSVGRRPSVSRRNSVNTRDAPALGRSNSSRRTSVVQASPPSQSQQGYSARQPNVRASGPPVSFPAGFNQEYRAPAPSARRPAYAQENPFAAPPTRGSGSSIDNPFISTPSVISSSGSAPDPWDVRVVQDSLPSTRQAPVRVVQEALPSARQSSTKQSSHQQRGDRMSVHSAAAARQATRAMGRATGYEDDYDSSDSSEEERIPTYATRTGMGAVIKGKRRS